MHVFMYPYVRLCPCCSGHLALVVILDWPRRPPWVASSPSPLSNTAPLLLFIPVPPTFGLSLLRLHLFYHCSAHIWSRPIGPWGLSTAPPILLVYQRSMMLTEVYQRSISGNIPIVFNVFHTIGLLFPLLSGQQDYCSGYCFCFLCSSLGL